MLIITTQKYFYCTQFSMRFNISIKPRHISKKPCTVSYDSFFSHGRSSYVVYYFYYCSKLDLLGEIICICFSELYYSYARCLSIVRYQSWACMRETDELVLASGCENAIFSWKMHLELDPIRKSRLSWNKGSSFSLWNWIMKCTRSFSAFQDLQIGLQCLLNKKATIITSIFFLSLLQVCVLVCSLFTRLKKTATSAACRASLIVLFDPRWTKV